MLKRRTWQVLAVVVGLLVLMGAVAYGENGTVQQVMRPDGVGLVVTGVDVSQEVPLEGYDVGLWLITPNFEGKAEAKGHTSTVVVVQGGKVVSVATGQGNSLPEVPAVPENGYVLIGSGMAHEFLKALKKGDEVTIVSKPRTKSGLKQNTHVIVNGGEAKWEIAAYDRSRQPEELIVYTSDFGTHTLTNEWGAEAVVVDGTVVSIRRYREQGLVEIPENGFVLSGHGAARAWIERTLIVGDTIELVREEEPEQVTSNSLTDEEFYLALNLDLPGLEAVKEAVSKEDWKAAQAAFASYMRNREGPDWHFNWRNPLAIENGQVTSRQILTAQDALNNRFTIIEIPHTFTNGIDWGYNPTTQPGSKYAANNEWTWQFNRHKWWVDMGRVYHFFADERYAEAFVNQMMDWVKKNPVPETHQQGPGSRWRSIEAGIRMGEVWPDAFLLFLRSPSFTDEALITMVKSMVEHARYLSKPTRDGNWLTMEMNGLYHVGVLFPEFKEAEGWRNYAAERMRKELDVQVYPDGAQYELSSRYHNVALNSFLGIVNIARLNGYELPEGYMERLESMFEFNLYMMTPSGNLPRFNDSHNTNVAQQMMKGYMLFPHRRDFRWAALGRGAGTPPEHTSYAFPYAGYVIQRSGWDADARYLAFDVGPFGAGHQYEDKLSFMLFAYGREFVINGGTYTYDASKWREYVRGPYAQNIVFVDGHGQYRRNIRQTYVTDEPLDYIWVTTDEYDFAQGSYGNRYEGFGPYRRRFATHQRSILFVKEGVGKDFWVVVDTLISEDGRAHEYEAVFHIDAEDVEVDPDTYAVRTIDQRGPSLGIFPVRDGRLQSVEVIKGQEEPFVQGWTATGSHEVKPIPTPIFKFGGDGVQHMLYVFYPVPSGRVGDVAVLPWDAGHDSDTGIGAEIHFPDGRKYQVFVPTHADAAIEINGEPLSGPFYLRALE